jgi:Mrp family chromosome partitioning ATPase
MARLAGPELVAQASGSFLRPVGIVLMAIGGLVLAAMAWRSLASALQRKITTVEDVEAATGLVAIGAIPDKTFSRALADAGPFEPTEGMRRICRTLEQNGLGSTMRVLTVVPAGGRRPGSTFAVDLARTLASRGQNILLVMANLRQPRAQAALGLSGFKGLAELLEDDSDDLVPLLISVAEHLMVLPPGSPEGNPAQALSRPVLSRLVASLRELGTTAIIDAPPASYAADVLPLASEADATLFIVRAGSRVNELQEAVSISSYHTVADPAAVLVGARR